MMRDKNRRHAPRTLSPESWAIRNTEMPDMDAEYQSATDISLVDISSDGIGIRTRQPLKHDKIISFDLCFSNAFYRVVARVLWTSQASSEWRSGLQILHMPEELMEEIEEYLGGIEKNMAFS